MKLNLKSKKAKPAKSGIVIVRSHKRLSSMLKLAREEKNLTLREVEKSTGISNAQISLLETGQATNPQLRNFWKLVRFYEIELKTIAEILDCEYKEAE